MLTVHDFDRKFQVACNANIFEWSRIFHKFQRKQCLDEMKSACDIACSFVQKTKEYENVNKF